MGVAGLVYAQQQHIPSRLVLAILPALCLEAMFYVMPGIEAVRTRLLDWPKANLASAIAGSALLPWLIYTLGIGEFDGTKLLVLSALVLPVAFWYRVLPPSRLADFGLLLLLAAPFLFRWFFELYPAAAPKLRMDFLGKWMWIRVGFAVFLLIRQVEGIQFGFIPSRAECITGLKYYFQFLPFGVILGYLLGLIRIGFPHTAWPIPILAIGTFLGLFWTVSLGEEFFFRGLIQQWLSQLLGRPKLALLTASILYGLVHLPFRGPFNWRYALLVTLLGWFCGQAFQEAGGIRAPMVTHALAATTWIVAFQKGA